MRDNRGVTLTETLVCLCLLCMASAGALRLSGAVSSLTARSESRLGALMAAREVLCLEQSRVRSLGNPWGEALREGARSLDVTVGKQTYVVTVEMRERSEWGGLWDWEITARPAGAEREITVGLVSTSFDPF